MNLHIFQNENEVRGPGYKNNDHEQKDRNGYGKEKGGGGGEGQVAYLHKINLRMTLTTLPCYTS